MIERNCTLPHQFHVFTDQAFAYKDCVVHLVPELPVEKTDLKGWWYKIYLFDQHNGLSGKVFYLDLDCVIIDNIDHLIEADDEFYICQDFNRHRIPHIKLVNSSVMQWTVSASTHKIWQQWQERSSLYVKKHRGDQDYLANECPWITFKFNNAQSIVSYKWEVCNNRHNKLSELEYNALYQPQHSILVFHGKPDPHEVNSDAIIKNAWR